MTRVLDDQSGRRRRYERRTSEKLLALTARKRRLLQLVGQYRLLSLPQAAALADLSAKASRNHLRKLFDAGLVEVIATSRAALADLDTPNDPRLLYGSAPGIYRLAPAGLQVLKSLDLAGGVHLTSERYGPKNSLHLAHELAIRDLLVWFARSARTHADHVLETWRVGGEAEIDLQRATPPKLCRPDAWLVYRMGERVLVGLLEADRGTERGDRRWQEKIAAYQALFASDRLRETTGYQKARVITIVPDARRRDHLAEFVTQHASPWLARRFWFAGRSLLNTPDLFVAGWRQPGSQLLRPLLRREVATGAAGEEEA